MDQYTVSLAKAADIDRCLVIDRSMDFEEQPLIYQKAVYEERVLIIRLGPKVVGYLLYGYLWDGELPMIQMIRVDAAYRKQGLGKQLVTALENILQQQNMAYLLSSTDDSNYNSLLFHKALNFVECGRLDINRDGTIEIFLKKKLE